jgi:hypothetical protein
MCGLCDAESASVCDTRVSLCVCHTCGYVCVSVCVWSTSPSRELLCLQADWPGIVCILAFIRSVHGLVPSFIPAAIRPKFGAYLVRVLRNARMDGNASPESLGLLCQVLGVALSCLVDFMRFDIKNSNELWKPAVDAGIIAVLLDLLTLGHEQTVSSSLELSGMLLMSAPRGEAEQWGVGLVQTTAQLLSAKPPVALRDAARMLHSIGMARPTLIANFHTWGINDSLQHLTTHSDPDTAAAAGQLKKLLSDAKPGADVSPALAHHIGSLGVCCLPYLQLL